jgi:hypothetical protein
MYAFTGAYFGLVGLIALPYASLLFGGSMTTFYQKAGYYAPPAQVDSVETTSGEQPSLERLAARAENTWPGFKPKTMILHGRGTPNGRVEIIGRTRGSVFAGTGSIVVHGATGEVLRRDSPRKAGALNESVQSMEVLHFAEFGGLALKILFFLLALASCAVILTGNFTWLEVRRGQDRMVNVILERLTAGVATGFAPATALLFLADRWHPSGISPDAWTDAVFFGSWGLCLLYALLRSNIARTHRTLLTLGGALAFLIPVANGLTTGDWPWLAWRAGHGAVLGVDIGALLIGAALVAVAACLEVDASPQNSTPQTHETQTGDSKTSAENDPGTPPVAEPNFRDQDAPETQPE